MHFNVFALELLINEIQCVLEVRPATYHCHAIILSVQNKNSISSIVHVAMYTIT